MKVFLGADHRGFKLKKKVVEWVAEMNLEFEDLGAHEHDSKDDYTTFAERVATKVAATKDSMGILMCGSGVGVDVMANKFDGVRSSIGKEPAQIAAGRADDNMNVLVIAADYTKESEAKEMVEKFVNTKFKSQVERYNRRLDDIKRVEETN